jgi:hypothetical protein
MIPDLGRRDQRHGEPPEGVSPSWAPGLPCPRCRRRHQTWNTVVACRWPGLDWVIGRVPPDAPCHAVLADCRRGRTVTLWETLEKAEQTRRFLDIVHRRCPAGDHHVFTMVPAPAKASR